MDRKITLKEFKKIHSAYKKGKSAAYLCRKNQISRTLFYRYAKRVTAKKRIHKLNNDQRLELINRVTHKGHKVSNVAKEAGISRILYYRWKSRHDRALEGEKLYALNPKTPLRGLHPRKNGKEVEERVLEVVAAHPELSSHKIAQLLSDESFKIGNHGVQNILNRFSLGVYQQRVEFAESWRLGHKEKEVFQRKPSWSLSLKALRLTLAPFATVPKLIFNHPVFSSVLVALFGFVLLYDLPPAERAGMLLAATALVCGLIFFAYSLKYYVTLALIVGFSQQKRSSGESKNRGWISRLLNLNLSQNSTLEPDLSGIKLLRQPFISVHIPFYNEKRVAERILVALSNLNYQNYEVIVADDSTDETKAIVDRFAAGNKHIKVSRRSFRSGYKGAALAKALEMTDKRAEYIVVFDADFIPFPDTLEQFMKYFAHLAGGDINQVDQINTAAVQGYQWHVLNKSENWVTRGVRTEYAGSYVVERSGAELYGGLKQIAGSVFCIRRSILEKLGWNSSITEDFSLTLRLYEAGYKVAYTPYIQSPSECVSTVRRLIRQRMRWAEGHSFNVARMFKKIMKSDKVSRREKFEFLYLSPYYLQAAFFIVGTFGWFTSEIILQTHLPYWSSLLGWSLVFSNFISLPLTNSAGLFLEESEEKDYFGIGSFALLSYILVPFQAYASIKGFTEKEEGGWFRTPKTGRITDSFNKSRFYKWIGELFGKSEKKASVFSFKLPALTANQKFLGYQPSPKRVSLVSRGAIVFLLLIAMFINYLAFFTPAAKAANSSTPAIEQQVNIIDQTYSTASTTYVPTDNSLGMFKWDSSVYDGISAVYFEAVIKTDGTASSVVNVELYDTTASSDNVSSLIACGTSAPPTCNNAYTRIRTSSNISGSLTSGDVYTVRIKAVTAGTVSINAARLIVLQTNATILKKSETNIEVGGNEATSGTSYGALTNPKYWCYSGTTSSCTSSSTVYNPSPTAYFEASIKAPSSVITKLEQQVDISNAVGGGVANTAGIACIDTTKYTSGTYYFEAVAKNIHATTDETITFQYSNGAGSSCTNTTGQTTTTLTITHNTTTPSRFRTAAITLTTGEVSITTTGADVSVYASRVIIVQNSGSALTATQTQHEFYNDSGITDINTAWSSNQTGGCPPLWYYDSTKFNPAPTIYFEAVMKAGTSTTANMELYDETSASDVASSQISTTSTSYTRVRSGSVTLTSGHQYAIKEKISAGSSAMTIASARVILEQGSALQSVETYQRYENSYLTSASTTYSSINRPNQFDPTHFTGTMKYYYEADLEMIASGTVYSQLYNVTDSAAITGSAVSDSTGACEPLNRARSGELSANMPVAAKDLDTQIKDATASTDLSVGSWLIVQSCTCMFAQLYTTGGSAVSGSEVSTNSTSWTLLRSGSISLTTGTKYQVEVHSSGTNNGSIANAHVILDQNSASGISALETYQMHVNNAFGSNNASATQAFYIDKFDDSNFASTATYYFEGTIRGDTKNSQTQTANLKLRDVDTPADVASSTISVTGGTLAIARSSSISPTTNKQYDTFYWCTTTGTSCAADGGSNVAGHFNSSWVIIDITNMPVPEAALILLPVVILLPYIIRRIKMRSHKRDQIVTAEVRNAF